MKTSLLALIFMLLGSGQTFAKSRDIVCSTPRELKQFSIKQNAISFYKEESQKRREIASVGGVRTKVAGNGFTKIVFMSGVKHTIHIENKKEFSEVDDYLVIKSKQGHEMTYPINCQWQ